MRLSNKQMEVKSIFGNVGGYISGPTSNGMTQDTTEKARKFDGTTLSFVYPGAMATPLLPLIG